MVLNKTEERIKENWMAFGAGMLSVVLIGAFSFYNIIKIRYNEEISIQKQSERLKNEASILEEKILSLTDSNKNRVIEQMELRTLLDAIGYRKRIRSGDDIRVFNPNILYKTNDGTFFKKYCDKKTIYKEDNTIYIPVKDAKRFLKK